MHNSSQNDVSKPQVTVVIPLHNHAAWISDAIRSAATQDYPRIQLVVVNDGSTDNSQQAVFDLMENTHEITTLQEKSVGVSSFLGEYPMDGPPIKLLLLNQPTALGPSSARNLGIRWAWNYTDLYAFLDSDDLYEPKKISKSVALWTEEPHAIGCIYSDYTTWNPKTDLRVREYKEPYSYERLTRECIVNCDSIISKEAFEKVGLFDENLRVCEDYDLWLRIAEKFIILHIPESLVTIRVGDHSSSSTIVQERWQSCYSRVFEKLKERRNGSVSN